MSTEVALRPMLAMFTNLRTEPSGKVIRPTSTFRQFCPSKSFRRSSGLKKEGMLRAPSFPRPFGMNARGVFGRDDWRMPLTAPFNVPSPPTTAMMSASCWRSWMSSSILPPLSRIRMSSRANPWAASFWRRGMRVSALRAPASGLMMTPICTCDSSFSTIHEIPRDYEPRLGHSVQYNCWRLPAGCESPSIIWRTNHDLQGP